MRNIKLLALVLCIGLCLADNIAIAGDATAIGAGNFAKGGDVENNYQQDAGFGGGNNIIKAGDALAAGVGNIAIGGDAKNNVQLILGLGGGNNIIKAGDATAVGLFNTALGGSANNNNQVITGYTCINFVNCFPPWHHCNLAGVCV